MIESNNGLMLMQVTSTQLFLSLLLGLACGLYAAYIAKERGRDPRIWFALGFCFGLLGIIVLLFLPSPTKEEKKEEPIEISYSQPSQERLWYYLSPENEQQGPYEFKKMNELLNQGAISNETYVWCEGMDEWKHVSDCPYIFKKPG